MSTAYAQTSATQHAHGVSPTLLASDLIPASTHDVVSVCAQDKMDRWEDRLDTLGSEPDLAQLRVLLNEAPDANNELVKYAANYYKERLPGAMQDWEDRLDAMGAWADLEALEAMLSTCPDLKHPTATFLAGVITQQVLADLS